MAYTKTTDFAAKDALLTGNPLKLIKGTEIGAEFDAIETEFTNVQNAANITLTSVSGTDTITAGAPDPFTAYANGQEFSFIAAGTNTGAVTLNIDSVGAIDVKKQGGIALAAGDITSGAFVKVKYVSATGDFEMLGGASSVTAPAGSAALPSVSTTGDLNTGMWFPAADTIAWSTGGTERLRIDGSGNVMGNTGGTVSTLDQVGSTRPYTWRGDSTSTAVGDGSGGMVIVNGNTTANNFSSIAFGALTGANANVYASALIQVQHGARTNGQYHSGAFIFSTSPTGNIAPLERMRIDQVGNVALTSPTGGLGYGTGAGGTVTQATSRTTGVTLNKPTGSITLFSAAGSTSWQTFTVTNTLVAATDTIVVSQKSGTDLNEIHVTAVVAGSFNVSFRTTGGTTTEQPVFNFSVIKGATS